MSIVYVLILAAVFGWIFDRRLPGGMMIGAVIGACLYNVLIGNAALPPAFKVIAQIVAGAFIGCGIQRKDLEQMRSLLPAAGIVILCLLGINLTAAFLIHKTASVSFLTALFASAPGGLGDIPIIAADMGADVGQVLALQLVRFMMGIAIFPNLIARLIPLRDAEKQRSEAISRNTLQGKLPDMLFTLAVAAVFGLLGRISPMPGGTIALATFGTFLFKLAYPKAWLSKPVRKAAQLLSGSYVGAGIGIAQIIQLRFLGVPALMLLVSYTLGAILIAALLQKLRIFSRREAFLAATPAGASDMALISADLGVYNANLVLLQVMRLLAVIMLFPSIFWVLAG